MRTDARPWDPYVPSADDPWDLRKAAHLHRRAGFGASRPELLRDLDAGPGDAVARLLDPPAPTSDEAEIVAGLGRGAVASDDLERLKAYWLYRVVYGPDPLREKLTLFWHGHFATSVKKVESVALMGRQNELLRRLALANFAALLEAVVADPAMLVWLDGAGSKKAQPNENFAREFLEVFTIGPGAYTEADVRAAARTFAGWSKDHDRSEQNEPRFRRDAAAIDDASKTFFGQTGPWRDADILRLTLERPEAAMFLARKLYRWFVSEADEPAADLLAPLAEALRWHGFAIRPVVAMILRSRHFYSRGSYRGRIKGPVEFSAGLVRMLEVPRSAFRPLALAAACDRQGQELFAPPNVKGWDGGPAWLTSASLLERGNWANDLVWGRSDMGMTPFDPTAWSRRHELRPTEAVGALESLLLQGDLAPEAHTLALRAAGDGNPDGLRRALQLLANCPEFQLA